MQFIGAGFNSQDSIHFNLIRDRAAAHDLLASERLADGPFSEGLKSFAEFQGLSLVQFTAFNTHDRKASSRQIADELFAFHGSPQACGFLDFFKKEAAVLPPSFYLIFACDWRENGPVRLERLRLNEVEDHFKRNNSWYLWLYNYSAQSHYPKLDLPLVLELRNTP